MPLTNPGITYLHVNKSLIFISSISILVPQPQVNIDPQSHISVVLGESLKLECQVTVPNSLNGTISSITWEHRDSILSEGITTMLSEGKSSLDLGVVVSAEAGVYLCIVLVMSHIHSNLSANSTVTVFVESEYDNHLMHMCVSIYVFMHVCTCTCVCDCVCILYNFTYVCECAYT